MVSLRCLGFLWCRTKSATCHLSFFSTLEIELGEFWVEQLYHFEIREDMFTKVLVHGFLQEQQPFRKFRYKRKRNTSCALAALASK